MKHFFTSVCLIGLLSPLMAMAAEPQAWKIIPEESSLMFTATQNNAPVTGKFKGFSGDIMFDPAQLAESNIHIVVDMNSLSTGYNDLTTTLETSDWFDIMMYPQAVFDASQFRQIEAHKYQAKGTLTIRNKSVPIVLTFQVDELSKQKDRVTGSTTLQRSAFGVGQGEWSDTKDVKDDVEVKFIIAATKK